MSGREFVDTNILVYADDNRDVAKQTRARELIRNLMLERRGVISLQVLQEFFAAATRKLGMGAGAARERVLLYARFEVVRLTTDDLLAAIDLHRLHGLSFWDGLIVQAALTGGCTVLNSEDMQHGRVFDALTVASPFAEPA
ncbi:MAG: PIN domain-containing protein [Pseudomonadales bacterium]|nr:PIN domain-containing protein [Pseudomonadales bacterium]